MLKRYIEFIKENYDDALDFHEALRESTSDLGDFSFSSMYKENHHNSPDEDYEEIQEEMNKYGFTFDKIREKFKGNSILNYVKRHNLDSIGGMTDIYLYKTYEKLGLDKNLITLGGSGWAEYVFEHDLEQPEAVIRYGYGYHKTEYGQIAIEQAGLDVKRFISLAIKGILTTELDDVFKGLEIINMEDFLINDDERILIMTQDICDELTKHNIIISNEELQDAFINKLSNYHLDDFDKTKDTLIVY